LCHGIALLCFFWLPALMLLFPELEHCWIFWNDNTKLDDQVTNILIVLPMFSVFSVPWDCSFTLCLATSTDATISRA